MHALRDFRYPRLWLWVWALLVSALLIVCLVPAPEVTREVPGVDKLGHITGYAALATYAGMLFASRRALALALLGTFAFGILVEGLQALVPWRSADVYDAVANAVGVLVGAALTATPVSRCLVLIDRRLG